MVSKNLETTTIYVDGKPIGKGNIETVTAEIKTAIRETFGESMRNANPFSCSGTFELKECLISDELKKSVTKLMYTVKLSERDMLEIVSKRLKPHKGNLRWCQIEKANRWKPIKKRLAQFIRKRIKEYDEALSNYEGA